MSPYNIELKVYTFLCFMNSATKYMYVEASLGFLYSYLKAEAEASLGRDSALLLLRSHMVYR